MAKIFLENFKFEPQRLAASGYAEFHPVASNDTAEGRGQNRRVDIIVLPSIDGVPQIESVSARPPTVTAIPAGNTPGGSTNTVPKSAKH